MYTPVKRKDLFNGSWFEVAKLLEAEISHGVLLQGSAVGLAEELEKLIKEEDVQTGYLQEENGNKGEEVQARKSTNKIVVEVKINVTELQSVCTHYVPMMKT